MHASCVSAKSLPKAPQTGAFDIGKGAGRSALRNVAADLIAELEGEVEAFLRELDDKVTRLRDLYSTAEAA